MQGVVFAWLVTMVLRESADRVGVARELAAREEPNQLAQHVVGVLDRRVGWHVPDGFALLRHISR